MKRCAKVGATCAAIQTGIRHTCRSGTHRTNSKGARFCSRIAIAARGCGAEYSPGSET
jgi:hypothetical protein